MNKLRDWSESPTAPVGEKDDEIDLVALGRVIWRGKYFISFVTLICIVFAGVYAFVLATPLYISTAVVAVNTQQPQMVSSISSVLSALGTDNSSINTETVVLTSRNLMEKVVKKLDLVKDPEFNTGLQSPSLTEVLSEKAKMFLGIASPQPSDTDILNQTIDQLLKQTSVDNIPNSYAFEINVTSQDPAKSARISNTIADLYINDQKLQKFNATEEASKFLSTRVAELQDQLQKALNKVKDFSVSTTLISPEALTALQVQLKELRDRLLRLQDDRAAAAKRATDLTALLQSGSNEAFAAFADDTAMTALLERMKAGTITKDEFLSAANALAKNARTGVETADEQIAALQSSEKVLSDQISKQSADLITLQQLQREADSTQALYDTFLARLKETDVQLGLELPDSDQLSQAIPQPPSSPRKGLLLAIATFLGLMIGSGLVLLREVQFASFRTSDELRDITGLRVLGTIPMIPNKGRKDALTYLKQKPASVVAEAIRNLRTSILLSNIDTPPKVLMVTSSLPGEGKTTQSLALAQNMASLGKRVILIEGDIRRRVFAEYFDTKHSISVLEAMNDPKEIANHDLNQAELGVDLLVAAKANVNAADLFASDKFSALVAYLREHYDFILIDTPPVLAVPDARVIGQQVDAILYTVKWDSTTRTQVRQGLEMFSTVGLKVTGLVLNAIDSRQMRRYGYGGQYGYDTHNSKYYDS